MLKLHVVFLAWEMEMKMKGEGRGVPLKLTPLSISLAFYDAFYVRAANRAN